MYFIRMYILNRIPYQRIGKKHFELWKDYAPNQNYFKVQECLAKVPLLEPKERIICSKTTDCISIGYAHDSAAYRILETDTDCIRK